MKMDELPLAQIVISFGNILDVSTIKWFFISSNLCFLMVTNKHTCFMIVLSMITYTYMIFANKKYDVVGFSFDGYLCQEITFWKL